MLNPSSFALALLVLVPGHASAQCDVEWSTDYASDTPGAVTGLAAFDDGEGPRLFMTGAHGWATKFAQDPTDAITMFDGQTLRRVGSPPILGSSKCLLEYDDGSGPRLAIAQTQGLSARVVLYSAGTTTTLPGSFTQLGGTIGDPTLHSIVVFDSGSGPQLHVGGLFQRIDGVNVRGVARFDGTGWQPLGAGLDDEVLALTVHDFGAGPRLVAGGRFQNSGATPTGRVASWDGTQWTPVGASPPNAPEVRALFTWNDGVQDLLIAGGRFGMADGQATFNIASFAAGSWSPLGLGVNASSSGSEGGVNALGIEVGAGSSGRLLVGGAFTFAGGVATNGLAAWDGSTWTDYSQGLVFDSSSSRVEAIGAFDFGGGPEGVVGGSFGVGTTVSRSVARRSNGTWDRLGSGRGITSARAGTTWDDGSGEKLYVACSVGSEIRAITQALPGEPWAAVGGGLHGAPLVGSFIGALTSFDGSFSGSAGDASGVYALGMFVSAGPVGPGGVPLNNVAHWDGTQWNALGAGLGGALSSIEDYALQVFDDGSGSRLFAVGDFQFIGASAGTGTAANRCAVWDGLTWTPLSTAGFLAFEPSCMEVFDDGTGPALYVGGFIGLPSGMWSPVVRWNGSGFTPLVDPTANFFAQPRATDLEVFDDGSGPKLWISGESSPGQRSSYFGSGGLATWDGTSLTAYASPLDKTLALAVTGAGGATPMLILGGAYTSPESRGGVVAWGDTEVEGFNLNVEDLFEAPASSGLGRSIYALGRFTGQGSFQSSGIAERSRTCAVGDAYCFGDGGVSAGCTPCPCGNSAPPGSLGGCVNVSGAGARLVATGEPRVADDTLRFEVRDMTPQVLGVLFSGDNRLPGNPGNPCFGLDSGIVNPSSLDGLRCMGGATVARHGGRGSDAAGSIGVTTNGWGPPSGPPGGLIAAAGFVAGQTRHFQVFHRDAVTSGCGNGVNTTQGISIQFLP